MESKLEDKGRRAGARLRKQSRPKEAYGSDLTILYRRSVRWLKSKAKSARIQQISKERICLYQKYQSVWEIIIARFTIKQPAFSEYAELDYK